jgi:hypothetical protein
MRAWSTARLPAGDGRDDADGLAVGDRRVEPSRKRTSSSATNTFTKRRSPPASSRQPLREAGVGGLEALEHVADGRALDR